MPCFIQYLLLLLLISNISHLWSLYSLIILSLLYVITYTFKLSKEILSPQKNTSAKKGYIIPSKAKPRPRKLNIEEINSLRKQDNFINKCTLIILAQLQNEKFDVPALAKEMYMVRITLYREIKKRTGRTAVTYIKLIRLIEAHKLLKETNLSISNIAYEVGFKAPSHFSTSYKKEYGCTPTQMRAKIVKS